MATIKQHEAIKRIMDQLDQAEPHVPDDVADAIRATVTLLNKDDLLPDLVSDEWESVDTKQASFVMEMLIGLSKTVKPFLPSPYPGIPKDADFVFHAKLKGKHCVVCSAAITPGVDWTAKIHGGYDNYCVACASVDTTHQDNDHLATAMQYPGLHLTENNVYRVDNDGVHIRNYGAQFRLITRHFPALDASTLMSPERARAYARKHGHCIACGEDIGHKTTRRSLAAGYGPVCAKRYGWPYPSESEAEAILSADEAVTI